MRSGLRRLERQTVIVHLLSGQSIEGVVKEWFRDSLLLAQAVHLDTGDKLGGELLVERARIDYYQVRTV